MSDEIARFSFTASGQQKIADLLARNREWARSDAEERAAVRDMDPQPHYELNDGTCVSCGAAWPCKEAFNE